MALFACILSSVMEALTLVKYLARYAGVSRRAAEAAVRAGKVSVDGVCVDRPEFRVNGENDITLDGRNIAAAEQEMVYIMLNKPAGYTCSASDPHAEHLAIELIDVPQRVFYAGRLDRDSEGLLIFSNDGNYVQELAHPRYGVKKLYRVTVNAGLSQTDMKSICSGLSDEEGTIRALAVEHIEKNIYTFLLNEGKKREIRRLVKAVGKRVIRLIRVRQGRLELGDLQVGKWRYLTPAEAAMAKEE